GELGVLRLLVRANARGDPLPPDQHGADQEDDRAPDLRPHRQILEAHAAPPSARSSISPASASTMRGSSSRARSISRSTSSCALAAISPARACAATRIASLSRAVSTRAFAIAASASRRAAARRSSALPRCVFASRCSCSMSCFKPSMYARRRAIAAPTGRKKITFMIARKTIKLTIWTKIVPSSVSTPYEPPPTGRERFGRRPHHGGAQRSEGFARSANPLVAGPRRRRHDASDDRLHRRDDEQQVEREHERDDRERFQNADAEEVEREDVSARLGLTGDRLDGLRADDTVADGGAEGDGRDDDREAEDEGDGDDDFSGHDGPFLVLLGGRQGEIHDAEEGEHERLDQADQEVEELDPDRRDRGGDRDVHRADHDVRRDQRRDHEQQNLAGEDVEREPHREDDRPRDLFDDVHREEPEERLEEVRVRPEAALANREELDPEEHAQREGRRRVQVGGGGAAERQAERLHEEHAELVEDPHEEEDADEDRHEALALRSQRPDREIGEEADDPLERRLPLRDPVRAVRGADPPEEDDRDRHRDPRRDEGVRMQLTEQPRDPGNVPEGVFADLFVRHESQKSPRRMLRRYSSAYSTSGVKNPARYSPTVQT